MPNLTKQDIEGVVPGESMVKPRGALPFDKPAKTASADAGVQLVFDAITEPESARRLIKTLKLGTPIDKVVESMMLMLHGEGIVSPQAIPLMAPAMASMIEGMAKIADTEINYSEVEDPWTKPDEDRVEKLVAELTGDLVPEVEEEKEETVGLMTPPPAEEEGIV